MGLAFGVGGIRVDNGDSNGKERMQNEMETGMRPPLFPFLQSLP